MGQKIAALEPDEATKRRAADALRKRNSRAAASQEREERKAQKAREDAQRAARLAKEAESSQAARIVEERIGDILYELSGGNADNTPQENKALENKISDYLSPYEANKTFEEVYHALCMTEAGVLILKHYGIEIPPLPCGWKHILVDGMLWACKLPSYMPKIAVYEMCDPMDLEIQAASYLAPPKSPPHITDEMKDFYADRTEHLIDQLCIKTAEQKRNYAEHIAELEKKYLDARRAAQS